jgi:PAS domain S-box-containing protein
MKIKKITLLMDLKEGVNDWNKPFIIQNDNLYSVYILSKGSLEFSFGFNHFLLKSNMILCVFPSEKYSVTLNSENIQGYKISFKLSKKEELYILINHSFLGNRCQKVSTYGIKLIELYDPIGSASQENELIAESHMLSAFFYLLLNDKQNEEKTNSKSKLYVEQTIKFMSNNLDNKLTLEDLSNEVCLCKHHYLRLFKSATGIPPMTYFTKMKINRASELLATTSYQIFEIAEMLSFSSDAHFSSVFKKYMSVSPTIYREHHHLYKERYIKDSKEYNMHAHSLLQTIIDSSPDLIFYKNKNSVLLGCNTSFCKVMGMSKSEIIGKTDWELFPKGEATFYNDIDMNILEMGKPQRNQEWMTYPDGTAKKFEVYKAPFYDGPGNITGILGISRDITGLG